MSSRACASRSRRAAVRSPPSRIRRVRSLRRRGMGAARGGPDPKRCRRSRHRRVAGSAGGAWGGRPARGRAHGRSRGTVRRAATLELDGSPSVVLVVGVNVDRKDHDDRKARPEAARARSLGSRGGSGHVSRGRRRAARDLGRAVRTSSVPTRGRPGRSRPRRRRGRPRPRPRRRHRRHRGTPAHAVQPHVRAREAEPRDRRSHRGRAARDPLGDRRHDRPERLQQARLFGESGWA